MKKLFARTLLFRAPFNLVYVLAAHHRSYSQSVPVNENKTNGKKGKMK